MTDYGDPVVSLELEKAFDLAIAHVTRLLRTEMSTAQGSPARPHLERLETELTRERARAAERGMVDREWFQKTVRGVIGWIPDSELTLVAALGGIVRVAPPAH